jgi:hypothetical protein
MDSRHPLYHRRIGSAPRLYAPAAYPDGYLYTEQDLGLTLRRDYSPTDSRRTHMATHHVGLRRLCPSPFGVDFIAGRV